MSKVSTVSSAIPAEGLDIEEQTVVLRPTDDKMNKTAKFILSILPVGGIVIGSRRISQQLEIDPEARDNWKLFQGSAEIVCGCLPGVGTLIMLAIRGTKAIVDRMSADPEAANPVAPPAEEGEPTDPGTKVEPQANAKISSSSSSSEEKKTPVEES